MIFQLPASGSPRLLLSRRRSYIGSLVFSLKWYYEFYRFSHWAIFHVRGYPKPFPTVKPYNCLYFVSVKLFSLLTTLEPNSWLPLFLSRVHQASSLSTTHCFVFLFPFRSVEAYILFINLFLSLVFSYPYLYLPCFLFWAKDVHQIVKLLYHQYQKPNNIYSLG